MTAALALLVSIALMAVYLQRPSFSACADPAHLALVFSGIALVVYGVCLWALP